MSSDESSSISDLDLSDNQSDASPQKPVAAAPAQPAAQQPVESHSESLSESFSESQSESKGTSGSTAAAAPAPAVVQTTATATAAPSKKNTYDSDMSIDISSFDERERDPPQAAPDAEKIEHMRSSLVRLENEAAQREKVEKMKASLARLESEAAEKERANQAAEAEKKKQAEQAAEAEKKKQADQAAAADTPAAASPVKAAPPPLPPKKEKPTPTTTPVAVVVSARDIPKEDQGKASDLYLVVKLTHDGKEEKVHKSETYDNATDASFHPFAVPHLAAGAKLTFTIMDKDMFKDDVCGTAHVAAADFVLPLELPLLNEKGKPAGSIRVITEKEAAQAAQEVVNKAFGLMSGGEKAAAPAPAKPKESDSSSAEEPAKSISSPSSSSSEDEEQQAVEAEKKTKPEDEQEAATKAAAAAETKKQEEENEEEKKKQELEAKKKQEEEEKAAAAEKKKKEEEEEKKKQELEAKKKKEQEEEEKKKQELEAKKKKEEEEEKAAKKLKEQEDEAARAKAAAEAEERRKKTEEEEKERKRKEEEDAAKRKEEELEALKKVEAAKRIEAEKAETRRKEEEEAEKKKRLEADAAAKAKEEEKRKNDEREMQMREEAERKAKEAETKRQQEDVQRAKKAEHDRKAQESASDRRDFDHAMRTQDEARQRREALEREKHAAYGSEDGDSSFSLESSNDAPKNKQQQSQQQAGRPASAGRTLSGNKQQQLAQPVQQQQQQQPAAVPPPEPERPKRSFSPVYPTPTHFGAIGPSRPVPQTTLLGVLPLRSTIKPDTRSASQSPERAAVQRTQAQVGFRDDGGHNRDGGSPKIPQRQGSSRVLLGDNLEPSSSYDRFQEHEDNRPGSAGRKKKIRLHRPKKAGRARPSSGGSTGSNGNADDSSPLRRSSSKNWLDRPHSALGIAATAAAPPGTKGSAISKQASAGDLPNLGPGSNLDAIPPSRPGSSMGHNARPNSARQSGSSGSRPPSGQSSNPSRPTSRLTMLTDHESNKDDVPEDTENLIDDDMQSRPASGRRPQSSRGPSVGPSPQTYAGNAKYVPSPYAGGFALPWTMSHGFDNESIRRKLEQTNAMSALIATSVRPDPAVAGLVNGETDPEKGGLGSWKRVDLRGPFILPGAMADADRARVQSMIVCLRTTATIRRSQAKRGLLPEAPPHPGAGGPGGSRPPSSFSMFSTGSSGTKNSRLIATDGTSASAEGEHDNENNRPMSIELDPANASVQQRQQQQQQQDQNERRQSLAMHSDSDNEEFAERTEDAMPAARFPEGYTLDNDLDATVNILQVVPPAGSLTGGLEAVIIGSGFRDEPDLMVRIGTRIVQGTYLSPNSILVVVPPAEHNAALEYLRPQSGQSRSGDVPDREVVVRVSNGMSRFSQSYAVFRYQAAKPAPPPRIAARQQHQHHRR